MYKVFIKNKPIFFIENDEDISMLDSQFVYSCDNKDDKEIVLDKHSSSENYIYVQGDRFDAVWKLFFGTYKTVQAAGGVVINNKDQVLFIFRNGFWDLPKGKVEDEEAISIAAIREVEEECGISKPTLISKLLVTYHTYDTYGENCIKPTHWYLMQYEGDEELLPQEEEGITNVQWVNQEDIASKMLNTYGSIIDVIGAFKSNKE
ncbi:NUDIX domain-containing protein [Flavobacteriales bacterium]|nr:NUDIX domain-containing protein [Flavobacteriales bacterium]